MLQSGSDYVNETIFTFVSNRKTKISLRRYSVKQISLKMKSELTERPWLRLGIRAKSRYKRAGISVWRSFADDDGRNEPRQAHCESAGTAHSSGNKLTDVADIVIDNLTRTG